MLQRLYRGQSDAAAAIETADESLDAAMEAAETERDALQTQIDAIDRQVDALWSQRDELCRQKCALEDAMSDGGYGDTAGGGMTVTVYPNGRGDAGFRASNDGEDIPHQMQAIIDRGQDLADELDGLDPDNPDDVARAAQIFNEEDSLNDQLNMLAQAGEKLRDWTDRHGLTPSWAQ